MSTTWTNISKAAGTSWIDIAKPSTGTVNIQAGMPIGLLLALTYTTPTSFVNDSWTRISKAAGTSWADIPKAT